MKWMSLWQLKLCCHSLCWTEVTNICLNDLHTWNLVKSEHNHACMMVIETMWTYWKSLYMNMIMGDILCQSWVFCVYLDLTWIHLYQLITCVVLIGMKADLGGYSKVNLQPLWGRLVLAAPSEAIWLVDPRIPLVAPLVPFLGVCGAGCDLPILDLSRDHSKRSTRLTSCKIHRLNKSANSMQAITRKVASDS